MQHTERIFWGINTFLNAAKNALEYPLRQVIKWRRGTPRFPNESKNNLFGHLSEDEQEGAYATEKRLRDVYHLEHFRQRGTADNYRLNLFYLEMLDKAFSQASFKMPPSIQAADVGPSDWFYLRGLHACLRWWDASSPRDIQLTGYEADAFRMYRNLFSRYDYACAYMQGLENVTYIPERFSPQPSHFHVMILFFPFIFLKDHLIWGLPRRRFEPERLLASVLMSLRNDGVLFIVNQGKAEHEAQKDMLSKHGITPVTAFKHDSLMYHYNIPRYVLLAVKE